MAWGQRSGGLALAQKFKPDLILVSAGYDGHLEDPLGNFAITAGGCLAEKIDLSTVQIEQLTSTPLLIAITCIGYSLLIAIVKQLFGVDANSCLCLSVFSR